MCFGVSFSTGKGASMWDVHSRLPNATNGNTTADVAADSYHRYKDDVKILRDLGVRLLSIDISLALLQYYCTIFFETDLTSVKLYYSWRASMFILLWYLITFTTY